MKAFVTYKLTNSEFSCYLYEQMNKHGFTYNGENNRRTPCKVKVDGSDFMAVMITDEVSIADDDNEYWYQSVYLTSDWKNDIEMMSEKFLEVLNEIMPLEKVDEPEKLYDALINDIENRRFECFVDEDMTEIE